ncbi:hypothetical protein DY000_02052827 [Brassica cretica]|uniref:Retrotransposon gag domain-containing protein n=1 Tax=Brassica cretica TaxID=69181 RepID=A0ABQ7A7L4_BRACR|nr:hypothetical protein DY000_02052827 [Brassica cretica]
MPVLLKSGQSASREEAIEEMKDCRSMKSIGVEKVEVLILKVDENGMLRDEAGRTRNNTGQLINAEGVVIPDVIDVAETNDFYLNREWYDWGSVDPFRGLPHEDPRDLIKELEELASASEQNEVSIDHIISNIFPYSLSGDAFSWFSQLQPRSLACWEDIKTAFLNKFLFEATVTRQKEFDDMLDKMIKGQEKELMSSFSQMLELHRRVRCLAMDGDLSTNPIAEVIPVLPKSGQSASREEDVEEIKNCRSMVHPCHRSTNPIAEVIPVLPKSGQSASREEDVEEIKNCRSMVHPCHRSTVMPEYGSRLTLAILAQLGWIQGEMQAIAYVYNS